MFVDEVNLVVESGKGGDGCTAFRREKYVPMGGPYGGNGGAGQDIVFKVDTGLSTLLDLQYKKYIKGKKGENGKGKNMHGKSMDELVVKVPLGTVVYDVDTNNLIADLSTPNATALIAKGGKGGYGNTYFKTQKNPAPNYSEKGEEGEVRNLKIELKLLADVGLVGLPSVGKSTIISCISRSKPKIADYPFTTLTPNLGVCKGAYSSFTVADLPGLIEGASTGCGLGDKFLRHIERTRIIAHVLDATHEDMYKDYELILKELELFNKKLLDKEMIIIINKIDRENTEDNIKKFKEKVKDKKIFEVSAYLNKGLDKVVDYLSDIILKIPKEDIQTDELEGHILYEFNKEKDFTITKENDYFVLSGKKVEKLFKLNKFNSEEAIIKFAKKLRRMGVDEELEKMGAKDGDLVKILDFYFTYKN